MYRKQFSYLFSWFEQRANSQGMSVQAINRQELIKLRNDITNLSVAIKEKFPFISQRLFELKDKIVNGLGQVSYSTLGRIAETLNILDNENPFSDVANVKIKKYDVFISHAYANKSQIANNLKKEISKVTRNVWYDDDMLLWGDNTKQKIYDGLQESEFGIVIISPEFMGRKWTEAELKELIEQENMRKQKVVLPILYNLSISDFQTAYPSLDEKQIVEFSKNSVKDIAIAFSRLLVDRLKEKI